MNALVWLILPVVAAGLALTTGRLPFKLAVPGLAAAILWCFVRRATPAWRRQVWAVMAAFGMSMVGDAFLSTRAGHAHHFEAGIAAFFGAHLGYLRYALMNGGLHRGATAVLLLIFVPYFVLALSPAIASWTLWLAVLLYLLISCVALAAAVGLRLRPGVKGLYVAGMALIVFSDTVISFSEFLRWRDLNALILPTYYLAHVAISASVLRRLEGGHRLDPPNPPGDR